MIVIEHSTIRTALQGPDWFADPPLTPYRSKLASRIETEIDAHSIMGVQVTTTGRSAEDNIDDAPENVDLYIDLYVARINAPHSQVLAWIDQKYASPFCPQGNKPEKTAIHGPGDPDSSIRNINHVDDAKFAAILAKAVFATFLDSGFYIKMPTGMYYQPIHGENYRLPRGVKMKAIENLRDEILGEPLGNCKACALEIGLGTSVSDVNCEKLEQELGKSISSEIMNFIKKSIIK